MLRLVDIDDGPDEAWDGAAPDSLAGEVSALREALRTVMDELKRERGEVPRLAGTAARLCDSITRAVLAQQKIAAANSGIERTRERIDRIWRAIGWGEEEE